MSAFSFSFSGDDIEDTPITNAEPEPVLRNHAAETGTLQRSTSSAFPITGQPLLQPQTHDLQTMLRALPSKIVYSTLVIKLDDGTQISIPRRELWDVRVQLMAEEDDEGLGNLGKDDVKTGVYEGGFKSWESSVDVVKVLYGRNRDAGFSGKVLELGCGTALPSLAVFQWLLEDTNSRGALNLGLADYNPTVLQLVTLPNILLSWAQVTHRESWEAEGELELDEEVVKEFLASLKSHHVELSFFSGAWSPEFVGLVKQNMSSHASRLTIIGAETIYSPAALKSFAETLMSLLESMPDDERTSLVAAKRVYFGVGGSMEDFCEMVRLQGGGWNRNDWALSRGWDAKDTNGCQATHDSASRPFRHGPRRPQPQFLSPNDYRSSIFGRFAIVPLSCLCSEALSSIPQRRMWWRTYPANPAGYPHSPAQG